jgi:hypothetical protein
MNQPEHQPDLNVIVAEKINSPTDSLATQEKEYITNDAKRKEGFKGHLHILIIAAMYFAAFLVLCLFAIRFWHFAVPERYCWLDKDHLHDIERIVFSSALLTALSFYFKNVFKMEKLMQKPILNICLFSGGALDGLLLSVEQGQRILTCTEIREGKEIFHQKVLSKADTFQYQGTT